MRNPIMTTTMAILTASLAVACTSDDPAPAGPDAGSDYGGVTCPDLGPRVPPTVPEAIQPPAGATFLTRTYATGSQIYTCKASASDGTYAWAFKAPEAALYDDSCALKGAHGAGPVWEWTPDGSAVKGMKIADAPAPATGDIPWLLLKGVENTGEGKFAHVTYVQRVATAGGAAPASGCDASAVDKEVAVPYTAVYYFWEGGAQP